MTGRPPREATPEESDQIQRYMTRMGAPAIHARMPKTPLRVIRRELAKACIRTRAPRIEWRPEVDKYLLEHVSDAGGAVALSRQLHEKFGVDRSPAMVGKRVIMLTTLGLREHRLLLSVEQVSMLIGRGDEFVCAEIGRRILKAQREGGKASGGPWRIVPGDLRSYVMANDNRVNWLVCERVELLGLVGRQWGVSEEERKRKAAGRVGGPK